MIIQERYLAVNQRPQSGHLTQISWGFQVTPQFHRSARLEAEASQFSAITFPYQKSGRVIALEWVCFVGAVFQKTARLVDVSCLFAGNAAYQKSARLGQGIWSFASTPVYQRSACVVLLELQSGLVLTYQKSARQLSFRLEGPWTTGSQVTPTPVYQKSGQVEQVVAGFQTVARYEKSGRLVDLSYLFVGLPVYQKAGRLAETTLIFQTLPTYQKTARLSEVVLVPLSSSVYQKSGRLTGLESTFLATPVYQRSGRLLTLSKLFAPLVAPTILQYTGNLTQWRLDKDWFIVAPTVIIPKDAMGDVTYYWVGWPGTDSPHKTRGRDSSFFFTMSLWKTPKEAAKSIEIWYPRLPIVQGDANRLLEVNEAGISTFTLSTQILPEIGVYLPILKDWLRAWYHSWKTGEYQKTGDLVRAGYHWNRHREALDLYEKAREALIRLDTAAKAPRAITLKPFRL